jgi:hypothetical protein
MYEMFCKHVAQASGMYRLYNKQAPAVTQEHSIPAANWQMLYWRLDFDSSFGSPVQII